MPQDDRHFTRSTLRERIVEHVFVGDMRPELDAHGYDVFSGDSPVRVKSTAQKPLNRCLTACTAISRNAQVCVVQKQMYMGNGIRNLQSQS